MKNSRVQFSSNFPGSNPVSLNLGPRGPQPPLARQPCSKNSSRHFSQDSSFNSAAHIILGSTYISCFCETVAIRLPLDITCLPIMMSPCPQKTDIIRRTRLFIVILHIIIRNPDIARGLTLAYFSSPRAIVANRLDVIVSILDSVKSMTGPAYLLSPRDLNIITSPPPDASGWEPLFESWDILSSV